ncbi:MAG TPA: nucleotidyl transferase AbiEii/AbiGii toxin family protein [Streptosporangiaceae bacterium]|nr:nucleotidyl transferase AbiEii/AbiGii toxin family protein [Streptosporangiaceae bacterium]
MNFNILHRRLMQDVLEIGKGLPLVITGGYAAQMHQLVDRLSRDLDVATDSAIPMEDTSYGPVLALYDVIGTKVRALAGRGLPRDLIDIHAASRLCSNIELESLGRCHAWDEEFSLSELKARLEGAEWYDDQAFAEYGLSVEEITELRMWALAWAEDIVRRIIADAYEEDIEDEPL